MHLLCTLAFSAIAIGSFGLVAWEFWHHADEIWEALGGEI